MVSLNVAAAHLVHSLALAAAYWPTAQGVQAVVPAVANDPAAQAWHSATLLGEKWPPPHVAQAVEPAEVAYRPATQAAQGDVVPVAGADVPTAHALQLTEPRPSW